LNKLELLHVEQVKKFKFVNYVVAEVVVEAGVRFVHQRRLFKFNTQSSSIVGRRSNKSFAESKLNLRFLTAEAWMKRALLDPQLHCPTPRRCRRAVLE